MLSTWPRFGIGSSEGNGSSSGAGGSSSTSSHRQVPILPRAALSNTRAAAGSVASATAPATAPPIVSSPTFVPVASPAGRCSRPPEDKPARVVIPRPAQQPARTFGFPTGIISSSSKSATSSSDIGSPPLHTSTSSSSSFPFPSSARSSTFLPGSAAAAAPALARIAESDASASPAGAGSPLPSSAPSGSGRSSSSLLPSKSSSRSSPVVVVVSGYGCLARGKASSTTPAQTSSTTSPTDAAETRSLLQQASPTQREQSGFAKAAFRVTTGGTSKSAAVQTSGTAPIAALTTGSASSTAPATMPAPAAPATLAAAATAPGGAASNAAAQPPQQQQQQQPQLQQQTSSSRSLTNRQALALARVAEALKLRFCIDARCSKELKALLGVNPMAAEELESDEDGQAEQGAAAAAAEKSCTLDEFCERLVLGLGSMQPASDAAAELFYRSFGSEGARGDLFDAHRQLGAVVAEMCGQSSVSASTNTNGLAPAPAAAAAARGAGLSEGALGTKESAAAAAAAAATATTTAATTTTTTTATSSIATAASAALVSTTSLNPASLLEHLEAKIGQVKDTVEVPLCLESFLADVEGFREGLAAARAQLAARKFRKAWQQDSLSADDICNVLRSLEDLYKDLLGASAPSSYMSTSSSSCSSPNGGLTARRRAQEQQTCWHLLHCIIHNSRTRLGRVRWGKSVSKRWARRLQSALIHVRYHVAHLSHASMEYARGDKKAGEQAREVLNDYLPLKQDKDATFQLHFSGSLRMLQQCPRPRPVVLIITCSFGGGHRAAARAVASYLESLAEVRIVDTSKDAEFLEKDLMHSLGKLLGHPNWDQTTLFNEVCLKRQLYRVVNFTERIQKGQGAILDDGRKGGLPGPLRSPEQDSTLKRILRGQFLSTRPDLVVSVYHMDVNPIMSLCEELGSLPMMHLATDLDIKMWEVFGKSTPAYPKFCVGVPFDILASWETTVPLAPSQVFLSGYPVRPEFIKAHPTDDERRQLREKFGLARGEIMVLVMTGGGGQDVAWPKMLANSSTWGIVPPSQASKSTWKTRSKATAGPPSGVGLADASGKAQTAAAVRSTAQGGQPNSTGKPRGSSAEEAVPAVCRAPGGGITLGVPPPLLEDGAAPPAFAPHNRPMRTSLDADNDGPKVDCCIRVVVVAGANVDLVKGLKGSLKPLPMVASAEGAEPILTGSNPNVSVQAARDPSADSNHPYFVGPEYLSMLMDIASVAISKPGGGSTAEIAYRSLPSVLDASKGAMHWEEFTVQRFEELGFGIALRSPSSSALETALRQALEIRRSDVTLARQQNGSILDTGARCRERARLLLSLSE